MHVAHYLAQTLQLQQQQQPATDAIKPCNKLLRSYSYASALALVDVFGHPFAQDIKLYALAGMLLIILLT